MKKLCYFLPLLMLFPACELTSLLSDKTKPKEKYSYYNPSFLWPSNTALKTTGVYCDTTIYKEKISKVLLERYYKKMPHPVLGKTQIQRDTVISYQRWDFYQFRKDGSYAFSGGYYSKEAMIEAINSGEIAFADYYKIRDDLVSLERYSWYSKQFNYTKGQVVGDKLSVGYGKKDVLSTFEDKTHEYVFYSFEELK